MLWALSFQASAHVLSLPPRLTPRPPWRAPAAEIIAFDNVVVLYKFVGDLHFYASADSEENEVILATVLSAFAETVSLLLTCVRCRGGTRVWPSALAFCAPCPLTPRVARLRAATWISAARWRTWTWCS